MDLTKSQAVRFFASGCNPTEDPCIWRDFCLPMACQMVGLQCRAFEEIPRCWECTACGGGRIHAWQRLGVKPRLGLKTLPVLRALFHSFVGSNITLLLRGGRKLLVEVFEREGEIGLGSGWCSILCMVGASTCDVVAFSSSNCDYIGAMFFGENGMELMPSRYAVPPGFPGTRAGLNLPPASYELGPGLTPNAKQHALLRSTFVGWEYSPMYVCLMNHTSINKGILYFNRRFSVSSVHPGSSDAIIRDSGWVTTVVEKISRGDDKIARLTSGWLQFSRKLGLRVGDVCSIRIGSAIGCVSVEVKVENFSDSRNNIPYASM